MQKEPKVQYEHLCAWLTTIGPARNVILGLTYVNRQFLAKVA